MLKAILIIVLAMGAVIGGLLVLRTSGRVGLPDDAVMRRAAQRAREQAAADDKEDGRPPK